MTGFWPTVMALVWKDVLTELRAKDVVTAILAFAVLSLVILNFAVNSTPRLTPVVAPGVLWVSFTFAGVLGLTRAFAIEKDRGNLEGLLVTPTSREALYVGKMLGSLAFMLVAEAVLLPVFAVLFNVSPFQPSLLLIVLLATIGFVSVGALFSRHRRQHPVQGDNAADALPAHRPADSHRGCRGLRLRAGGQALERHIRLGAAHGRLRPAGPGVLRPGL